MTPRTLVSYRTSDRKHLQFSVVPTIYLSDLLNWLKLSETAEIVRVTHNCDDPIMLPEDWPTYQTCLSYNRESELYRGMAR